jgi:hypothetical protein
MNFSKVWAVAALVSVCALPVEAGEKRSLGWGRIFSNDILGDGEDRWRTGGYSISNVRGADWNGARPTTMGEVLEYRLRMEIIAPESLFNPSPTDRRYAGTLSFGVHTHFQRNDIEMNLGFDLVATGPQLKLDDLHEELHDLVGGPTPRVSNSEVDNAILPTLTFEAAKSYKLKDQLVFRPFGEIQAGAETFARAGFDMTFGNFGTNGLRLRDNITGQRYAAIVDPDVVGLSFMAGADVSYIADSYYLDTPGIEAKDVRGRLRLGIVQEWELGGFFYGATYLSPEFEGQREGQVVGSINARFQF